MHIAVWIITPVTPRELGIAFQKARELAEPFGEERWRNGTEDPDKRILPPSTLHHDQGDAIGQTLQQLPASSLTEY